MGNEIIIGLQLSAIGLAVTFLALGLLIFVMVLLQRVFSVKHSVSKTQSIDEPALADEEDQRLEELAVALAVGICLLEREGAFTQRDPSLGKLLEHK